MKAGLNKCEMIVDCIGSTHGAVDCALAAADCVCKQGNSVET